MRSRSPLPFPFSSLRTRPPTWALACVSAVLLGGCSSLLTRSTQEAPAPVVDRSPPPEPVAAAPAPNALPLLQPAPLPLPVNLPDNSYAGHPQSQPLAVELAREMALSPEWIVSVLAQAQRVESVRKLIMPASNPGGKNWQAYRARFIEPIRLKAGAQFWQQHADTLARAESRYGVPRDIIAGVIGVETIYGRYTGQFRVLDVLTTLTLDFPAGRSDRSGFFRKELAHFLRLCAEQGSDPTTVMGSFAGAIGLPQFMPSSIRHHAVDFDGDGHIDLLNSQADAIGSVAHYLAAHGWQSGMPTHYTVAPPQDATARETLLGPDIKPTFTVQEMRTLGAELDPAGQQHTGKLALVMLHNGGAAPTYVAGTDNFYAITRYNQSSYYALAVIELGRTLSLNVKSGKD